jgi:hypothetical protein
MASQAERVHFLKHKRNPTAAPVAAPLLWAASSVWLKAFRSSGGNRYAEHHVARHCGGFYRGDSDLDGSHNVDCLASKGCRDTCSRSRRVRPADNGKSPRQTATVARQNESAERLVNHACGRHEPPPYPHCGGLDLREVPTLTLERLFAFVVVGRSRRRLLWFAATGPMRHARAIPSVGILPEMRTLLV